MPKQQQNRRGLIKMGDPLEGIPVPERIKIIRDLGEKAKATFEQLKADIDKELQKFEPIHCVCAAGYLLAFVGDKPITGEGFPFGQHQAELLQALVMRHPTDYYEEAVGTPDQVQAALDLAKGLSDARLKIPYADIPEDEDEFHRRSVIEEMRLYTQVMRGEYYPEQWTRLFRPSLEKIAPRFIEVYDISPAAIYDLIQCLILRIEDRLNDHVKRVASFYKAPTLNAVVKAYKNAFPEVRFEIDELRGLFNGQPDAEIVEPVKVMLLG